MNGQGAAILVTQDGQLQKILVDDERVGQFRELQVSDSEEDQQGIGIIFRQLANARRLLGPPALGIDHCTPYGAGKAHDFGRDDEGFGVGTQSQITRGVQDDGRLIFHNRTLVEV